MKLEADLKRKFAVDYRQQDAFDRLEKNPHFRVFSFEAPNFKPGLRIDFL